MKRILTIVMTCVMMVGLLAACGGKKEMVPDVDLTA